MRKIFVVLLLLAACDDNDPPDAQQPTGQGETVFAQGDDATNPFFVALGTNQRTCATCHDREAGWSVTPTALQARFDATGGEDPIFRPVDGATSPGADVSTLAARREAYALLLDRGLVRVGEPMPAGADFTLAGVSDPYGFASAAQLSLFRRPLPSANLRFLAEIMWDSREAALEQQAIDATLGHAQATLVAPEDTVAAIVAFESSAYTAQRFDDVAGDLAADGGQGGAAALMAQEFHVGVNDPTRASFDRDVFTLYDAWTNADTSTAVGRRRAAIARGERLFDTHRFRIRGVAGLPDQDGTCSTCHDTPNVGSRSVPDPLDIGVSDAGRRPPGLPVYTLRRSSDGRTVQTSDPGLALVTGRWDDIGRFKVPSLRGLAMRPPYFHNGLADDLNDVLRFYRRRFDADFSDAEEGDLVAFLSSL